MVKLDDTAAVALVRPRPATVHLLAAVAACVTLPITGEPAAPTMYFSKSTSAAEQTCQIRVSSSPAQLVAVTLQLGSAAEQYVKVLRVAWLVRALNCAPQPSTLFVPGGHVEVTVAEPNAGGAPVATCWTKLGFKSDGATHAIQRRTLLTPAKVESMTLLQPVCPGGQLLNPGRVAVALKLFNHMLHPNCT